MTIELVLQIVQTLAVVLAGVFAVDQLRQMRLQREVCAMFESMGPLIARGHLSLDYYADFYRGATILCWRKLQPYVEEQRANGFSNLFEWFQWLAERLEARSPSLNASAHVQFAEWKSPADFQRLRFRSKEP